MAIDGNITLSGSIVVGSPTGGDKGVGTINAQDVYDDNVKLTDYVFDKYFDGEVRKEDQGRYGDYQMKSLDEMTTFIEKERHLPTMAGRSEWEKEGAMPLGKIVTQLWETAETQALYIKELRDMLTEILHISEAWDSTPRRWEGRFSEMDAPIFADEAKTLVDSRKLKQLEHGAMRQLLRRIEELEEKIKQLQEAVEDKKGRQIVGSLK